jgi:hypothetical protein
VRIERRDIENWIGVPKKKRIRKHGLLVDRDVDMNVPYAGAQSFEEHLDYPLPYYMSP